MSSMPAMSSYRYAECLLFIVSPVKAPDRDHLNPTIDGLVGYLLLPSLGNNVREPLRTVLDSSELHLIEEGCPPELITATRNDQVEIMSFHLDLQHLQLEKTYILINVDYSCSKPLEKMLAGRFRRFGFCTENFDRSSQSVFRDEACMKTIVQIVEHNPNIQYWNSEGETFLHLAVSKQCEFLVRSLLEHGAKTDIRKTYRDETALHVAIRLRTSDTIVALLLKYGSDLNSACNGWSPLLLALRQPSCNFARLELLLENGADADTDWESVLREAAKRGPEFLACVLSSRHNSQNARSQQALRSFLKESFSPEKEGRTVKVFLEHGVNLVPEDAEDTRLFFGAIELDCYEVVEKLLKWGASVRGQVGGRTTALHVAAKHAGEEIIRLLVDNGAALHARNSNGKTPLSLAISVGNVEAVKCLLEHESKIPDLHYHLHEAAQTDAAPSKAVEIVKALIEADADVSIPNKEGHTPIMSASRFCRGEVMEEMWRHGARMNLSSDVVRGNFGKAVRLGALSAVKFYLKNGVELEGGVKEAIEVAIDSENQAMVQFFMEFDDPCARTLESGVLKKALCMKTPLTVGKDVLEYGYTSLEPIITAAKDRSWFGDLLQDAKVTIHRHILAIVAAELGVNQRRKGSKLSAKALARLESYKLEVQSMKDAKIGNSDVTFYDVLNSPLPEIARLLQNDSIVEALKAGGFGADFPSYVGMITKRFRKALFRKNLAERGVKMLDALCAHLPELPYEVKEKVVNYLSNQHLYVLTNVCQLPSDEIVTSQSQE